MKKISFLFCAFFICNFSVGMENEHPFNPAQPKIFNPLVLQSEDTQNISTVLTISEDELKNSINQYCQENSNPTIQGNSKSRKFVKKKALMIDITHMLLTANESHQAPAPQE